MAEKSISYGMGLSDQMINQMLQSDDPSIVAQAQNYVNQSQTQQEEKPSLLKRIGNFFISPAASAEVDINSNQNTLSEDQLNYLLQSSYLPSDTGFQIGQFGPNQNYLGKGMRGLESLGIGPNLNYLGDGPMTGSIGIGPNQNYLGKGMQIGSIGQPRYDSGTQTIFPSNISPALSDLGGITPSYGVANEDDVEQVDSLTGEKKSSGIMDLIMSIAVPGYGFLKNIGKGGLEGIRGLNQRIQQSDFGRSKTLADYFDARSYGGRDARDRKASQTMREARGIQTQVDRRGDSTSRVSDRNRSSVTTSSAARSKGVGGGGYTASDSTRESYRGR